MTESTTIARALLPPSLSSLTEAVVLPLALKTAPIAISIFAAAKRGSGWGLISEGCTLIKSQAIHTVQVHSLLLELNIVTLRSWV